MEQIIFSSNSFFLTLCALFPLFIFVLIKQKIKSRNLKLPPSPTRLPFIGNLHQIGNLPHKSLLELSLKHGPVMFVHFGKTRRLVVSSGDALEELTKNHDIEISNRPPLTSQIPLKGNGQDLLYHPHGDHWNQVRKIGALHLLSKNMVDSFQTIRDDEISSMLETIHASSLKGEEIDLTVMFNAVVTKVVHRAVTGRFESRQLESATRNFMDWDIRFKKAMESFCVTDVFPSLAWIDRFTGLTTKIKSIYSELEGHMENLINERKNESFVDILVRLGDDNKLEYDVKAILQEAVVASIEAGAMELQWVLSELITHPEVLKRVQEEVQRVVGSKSKISNNEISQMHYLKCIIKETLRLHPPGMVPRKTSTKWVKVGGYDIPPETKVVVNLFAIHRDTKYWEKPDEFIPERFMDKNIDFKGYQGFAPFGFGRRSCPGMAFGSAMLEDVLANILYWFDWKMPNDSSHEELNMEELNQFFVGRKYPLRLVPVPTGRVNQ